MFSCVSQKVADESNSSNNAGVEHVKKMYARQRAKDLAEHAKSLMSKEKELEELKKQLSSQPNDQLLPVSPLLEVKNNIQNLCTIKLGANVSVSTHSLPKTLHQASGSCTCGITEFFRSLCGITYFQQLIL